MKKLCINCRSENIEEVIKDNQRVFYCNDCKKTNPRFFESESNLASFVDNGKIAHVTAGMLIKKNTKAEEYLFLKKRSFPYELDIPAGHLEYGETGLQAAIRETMEETGLTLINPKLVFNETMHNDPCRYGSDIHLWYVYEGTADKETPFVNSEASDFVWMSLKDALDHNLVNSARRIITNFLKGSECAESHVRKFDIPKDRNLIGALQEKQIELLYHISNAVFKLENMNKVMDAALAEILSALKMHSASIMLLDKEKSDLEIKSYRRFDGSTKPSNSRSFKLGEGAAGTCAMEKQAICIDDISKNKVFIPGKSKKGAIICIPMFSSGELLGVISVRNNEPKIFTEQEVQFLSILSSQIAIAIENSLLYQTQENKIRNLSKLFSISTNISQVKPTIKKMVDVIPALMESEKAQILLYNEPNQSLDSYVWSDDTNDNGSFRIPLSETSISKSVFTNRKLFVSNDTTNEALAFKGLSHKYKTRSMLSAPILSGDHCYGVINIINKNNNKFSDEDMKLAQIVASRIAARIENYNLVSKTEKERELLINLVNNISDGVVVVDQQGKILVWNKFVEEFSGLNADQAIGKQGLIIAKSLKLSDVTSIISESLKNLHKLKDFYFERKITNFVGEQIWLGFNLSHISEMENGAGNILVVIRDLSKEKELIQAKNDFITTTTHELRTPLTTIKGYLSMLLHGDAGQLTPKQAQYFSKAFMSTERLVQLVEDLLVALKIEENKVILNIQAHDLDKIILESIENVNVKAVLKNIKINYSSQPNQYLGLVDNIKTKHAFENLIDNAIKYTRKNGKIDIKLERDNNHLLIKIKDNGVGISKKNLTTIFDRFTRIQNSLSVEAGGTGLGLYIVKNFIERQKGKIYAESDLGKGSTFCIELPSAIN